MEKTIILGDGLLGSEIVKQTNWDFISRKKDNIDILNFDKWKSKLNSYNTIVNCIAHTQTYSSDKELHWKTNYEAVYNLIQYCNSTKKKLIHISTDFVYANSKPNASENDVPVHCDNWYTYTKLLADGIIELLSNDYLICRCTHKTHPWKFNEAYIDKIGNFDYTDVIADLIIQLIKSKAYGIYNVGTKTKSMYDLASSQSPNVLLGFTPEGLPKNTSMLLDKLNNILTK
jgi:dTDP-4-dehydrorhamnose reductase